MTVSFETQLILKRKRNVSAIEDKVISMYARGMFQRDISSTIEDTYGFSVSHEMISEITDTVLPDLKEWQSRPLSNCYPFVFVDFLYTTIRNDYETKKYAVYRGGVSFAGTTPTAKRIFNNHYHHAIEVVNLHSYRKGEVSWIYKLWKVWSS